MSGGVDSSVAAALLKKQGYDVVGVFMRFWGETDAGADSNRNTCCSEGAEEAARAVAAKLEIPFYVLNFQKEFRTAVVDHFLAEMARGRTPNPCIVCNKRIKFGMLFQKALGMGADYIATGHYARLLLEIRNSKSKIRNKSQIKNHKFQTKLFRAKDENKDQSYFLYSLKQQQLANVLFPLGNYKKEQVYQIAKKWRLPFRKEESFDLCFAGKDISGFISRYLEMKKGKIMNLTGRVLGEHSGLAHYTIGQRKNLSLTGLPAPWRGPWWVIKKDNKKNILYVSNNEKDLYSTEVVVKDISWISVQGPKLPIIVLAKIRYKSEAIKSQITNRKLSAWPKRQRGEQILVKFSKPQRAATPGQSVVFYSKKGEVLGGGVIS
ncbi:MAG: tRNA 2-thiouridine(34) synthase MnmA [Candidatus Portnoybacteria bacterium RBG_19FT_COMBO_36_7]|uniref:tRNA-specific 2-thiouridylase MnmA n=1 Tax=Candidatus Portnoybacteria bacterium RBG_19FT_COMBO_36_7 TaxID=1801992 RepID=A0A1G2FAR3_9BACT|nr:MAG: tRNA 2-thiouridine(34) synthase MnmA [Candidatus Portnoybacteria bacterium RBG_19FT_COMBO_36_7]